MLNKQYALHSELRLLARIYGMVYLQLLARLIDNQQHSNVIDQGH